jgi:hypothetical protein
MSPPKHVDLMVLAAALAVFLIADLPIVGYAFGAGAWLIQRGVQELAARRSEEALRAGNRQRALGLVAGTTLGRVWLMVTGALLAGLIDHEAGLAAAVLLVVLFTVSFAAGGLAHLFRPEPEGKVS